MHEVLPIPHPCDAITSAYDAATKGGTIKLDKKDDDEWATKINTCED